MSRDRNGFDVAMDILAAFGRAAIEAERQEQQARIAPVVQKPEATDEDIDVLVKALKSMYSGREKAQALAGWCAYRTMSCQQAVRVLTTELYSFEKLKLLRTITDAKGISDPHNAVTVAEGLPAFDKSKAVQMVFSQGTPR